MSALLVAVATEGDAPYSYMWSSTTGTPGDSLLDVGPGLYAVTVTDANGCVAVDSLVVTEPDSLGVTLESLTDASCFNLEDGSIDISVRGGTAPYSFSWSNGSTSEDLSNLGIGDYTGTITDVNGCVLVSPVLSIGYQDSLPTGDFSFIISGGVVSFTSTTSGGTLDWTFGDGTTAGNDPTPSNTYTTNGTYSVTLTVTNECGSTEVTKSFELNTVSLDRSLLAGLIRLQPNPAQKFVDLNFNSLPVANWEVRIFTMDGSEVLSRSLVQQGGDFQLRLDIPETVSRGIYLVQVQSVEGYWTDRLRVE